MESFDMNSFKLEWTIDFERPRPARLGGIEDWMLMRRLGVLFSVAGTLCAASLVWAIAPFDNASFVMAYAVLAGVTGCFALVAGFRAATAMKFETGPRLLDIPRLAGAFKLAALLIVPCVLLQIGYPLKLVWQHRSLTEADVRPIQDLLLLYENELDKNRLLSIPVSKASGQTTPSADPNNIRKVVGAEIDRQQSFLNRINDDFAAIDGLGSRYPIVNGLALTNEHHKLQNEMADRLVDLGKITDTINQRIEHNYQVTTNALQKAETETLRQSLIAELQRLEKTFTFDYGPKRVDRRCTYPSQLEECRLFDRFVQLWLLRKRSHGSDLFPEGPPKLDRDRSSSPNTESLMAVLLFGWQGVLPLLIIAATFGVALRVVRLTDKPGFYAFCAFAIPFFWSFAYAPPSLSASRLEEPDPYTSLLVTMIGSAVLWTLMQVPWSENPRAPRKSYPQGRVARATMLMAPTIVFMPLFYLDMIGVLAQADWLVVPYLLGGAALIFPLVRKLDTRVVEFNCKPLTA
jgi:hypothetical protein